MGFLRKIRHSRATFRLIWRHPLSRGRRFAATVSYVMWQLRTAVNKAPAPFDYVGGSRLYAAPGVTNANGQRHLGLFEFEQMAFLLHFLREGDLFVDVGANVGAITILASGACGAQTIAAEPLPSAVSWLEKNVELNDLGERVDVQAAAIGSSSGEVEFRVQGAMSRVADAGMSDDAKVIKVPLRTLDEILGGRIPVVIKIDTEGYEMEVVGGATKTIESPGVEALVLEIRGHGDRYGAAEDDLHGRLVALGFTAVQYDPWTRALAPLESIDEDAGDTIYVRNVAAASERVAAGPKFTIKGHTL